jgi:predicted ArsR family transcriptional regulator
MRKSEPDRDQDDIEAVASLREPIRRRLYVYVARQIRSVGRDEAAEVFRISRSLAAFHLDRLAEVGLLTTEYRRPAGRTGPGAGRPAKLYRRSRRRVSATLPRRDHELLASLLAKSLPPLDPSAGSLQSAQEVGRSMGARARKRLRGTPPAPRLLVCVEDVLEEIGFEPYEASDREVRTRNCPFDPVSRRFTGVVCDAGVALAKGIVDGVGANVTVRRHERPDQCCVVIDAALGGARAALKDEPAPRCSGSA